MGVSRTSHNWACRAELGLLPLQASILSKILSFYSHLNETSSTLLRHSFQVSIKLSNYKVGWFHQFKKVLDSFKISPHDIASPSINDKITSHYRAIFCHSLSDDSTTHSRNKLRTNRQYKQDITFEPYLTCNIKKFRTHFTKLRLSDHRLKIETGRRTKPPTPLEKRLCDHCQVLEDEFHYVISCKKYTPQRLLLFQDLKHYHGRFLSLNSHDKFNFIFSNCHPKAINSICYHVYYFT